ncbi:MAG: penicillin-binding protein 2 [Meiothermus sp.]|nr:penicillin-binding protein 2 [Meiothermus sp.]
MAQRETKTHPQAQVLQASLHRSWVVFIAMSMFVVGMGYGLYTLYNNAPALLSRASVAYLDIPPMRGAIRASDGTPLALSTTDEVRVHPMGLSASQLLGFGERANGSGLAGLERDLEETLKAGGSVRLTLDANIQALAERALWRAMEGSKSEWGVALVMEAKTGRLLAVANGPRFDPTAARGDISKDISWRNHAFTQAIEPGSTQKSLTAAILMEAGVVKIESRVEAPMFRVIAGRTINDIVRHPPNLTLAEVLKYSSNVGITRLAERVPNDTIYEFFRKLHFTDPKPMPAVSVGAPLVRPVKRWGPLETANAAFGQGFLVTPLHMLAAYNALANDGVYQQPVLLEGQVSKAERVFRPEVAQSVRRALTDGVAERAKVPGYLVGGKTGTAQVVVNGRYSSEVFAASFAGFIPSDKPRVTVLVTLFHPKGGGLNIHGSMVSAPVFREVAAGLFAQWGLPPVVQKEEKKDKKQ